MSKLHLANTDRNGSVCGMAGSGGTLVGTLDKVNCSRCWLLGNRRQRPDPIARVAIALGLPSDADVGACEAEIARRAAADAAAQVAAFTEGAEMGVAAARAAAFAEAADLVEQASMHFKDDSQAARRMREVLLALRARGAGEGQS